MTPFEKLNASIKQMEEENASLRRLVESASDLIAAIGTTEAEEMETIRKAAKWLQSTGGEQ